MAAPLTPKALLEPTPLAVQGETLANLTCDGKIIKEKTILRSRFLDLGFKRTKFEDCLLNHGHFERCHFRKAQFTNVNFTGCFFRDCRFDDAEFVNCHFDYAEFHNCSVTFEQLRSCLPVQENVLWKLARNLRVNAQNRGLTEDYRKFLLAEITASETYNYKKAFASNDPYYRRKYPRLTDRFSAFWHWSWLKLEGVFWGHGEVPIRVIRFAGIVVFSFALLFHLPNVEIRNMPPDASFLEYLGFSAATFATAPYGDLVPSNPGARALATIEAALGLLVFGFLAAALYRRVSKR